jgi:hypothetical protein
MFLYVSQIRLVEIRILDPTLTHIEAILESAEPFPSIRPEAPLYSSGESQIQQGSGAAGVEEFLNAGP